jgi:Putative prokaryotic signal transducing protein
MKRIYEAASNVEAHMLAHLLAQSGIEAHVQGEHLQSGAGELPLGGLVALAVAEEDAAEATRIIREWERQTVTTPDTAQIAQAKRAFFGPMLAFVVGALSGAGVVWSLHHGPETSDGVDWNRDGVLDERVYFDGDRIVRVELDRNFDGRVDAIERYDARGLLERFEQDDDFDGRRETTTTYHNGEPHLAETDADGDGDADYRMNYEFGLFESYEYLNANGAIVKRVLYRDGYKQDSAQLDLDADGQWERMYRFDRYDEPIGR